MKNFISLILVLLLISPIIAQTKEEKKKLKEEAAQKEYEATKVLIESGTYSFNATFANTQKGRRIDLTTNSGYLTISNNKAKADLPYFGVVHVASIGNSGVEFENENVEFEIEFDDKKQRIGIDFKANHKSESYDISLTVFKNGNANLTVSSVRRDRISYSGNITALKK